MKFFCSFLLSFFCFFSSFSSADISIDLMKGVVLLAHNGKEVSSDSAIYQQDNVRIKNGTNQIVVQYSNEIKNTFNDSEIEKTGTYIIVLEAVDENLMLSLPILKNSYDFSYFKKNPEWKLSNKNGEIKEIKVAELVKEGFQLNRDYEKELTNFNMTKSSAAINSRLDSPVYNSEKELEMSEKMLKYWYTNSTPEVKAAFIKWIGQ